jgi:hypothetical protein
VQEVSVSVVPLGVDVVPGFVYSSLTSLVTFRTDDSMSAHAKQLELRRMFIFLSILPSQRTVVELFRLSLFLFCEDKSFSFAWNRGRIDSSSKQLSPHTEPIHSTQIGTTGE